MGGGGKCGNGEVGDEEEEEEEEEGVYGVEALTQSWNS